MEDESRTIARSALKAALATSDMNTGAPYCSLVTLATTHAGAPIMLLSALARHTKNLKKDPRASLLIESAPLGSLDPLAGARLTLTGTVQQTSDPVIKQRFLTRHPEASGYAEFPDFSFFEFAEFSVYVIGGFGKFLDLTDKEFLVPTGQASTVLKNEKDLIEELNGQDVAKQLLKRHRGNQEQAGVHAWRVSGIDPLGLDIIGGIASHRAAFEHAVSTPEEVRSAVNILINQAD